MARYYVNKNAQSNGDHEVHALTCAFVPEKDNRTFLGDYARCQYAVNEAKNHYSQVNGCYYCCRPCHTG